jgi:predicted ABC-type sugar transport system permease subunit
MLRRLAAALRIALREEDFARILAAAHLLITIGTITFTLGADWSLADGFYIAVATLTTSSILNPNLTTDPWLEIFTAAYVLVGIGILVEAARAYRYGFHRSSRRAVRGEGEGQDRRGSRLVAALP